jgi:hypothetical protein
MEQSFTIGNTKRATMSHQNAINLFASGKTDAAELFGCSGFAITKWRLYNPVSKRLQMSVVPKSEVPDATDPGY